MEVEFKFSVDEMGRNVCKIEDENFILQIILKKDYYNIEEKFRDLDNIDDMGQALGTASETKEFKDIVDSYGYLYVDNLND